MEDNKFDENYQSELVSSFGVLFALLIIVGLAAWLATQKAEGIIVQAQDAGIAKGNLQGYVAEVSAYCPCSKCCGKYADGITASGHKIKAGDKFCAADKSIPFGTMIDIPGYGKVPVLDRGGAIKDGKLDVFFHTHKRALLWGRQKLNVRIAR